MLSCFYQLNIQFSENSFRKHFSPVKIQKWF
jgi:hypothetical protein